MARRRLEMRLGIAKTRIDEDGSQRHAGPLSAD